MCAKKAENVQMMSLISLSLPCCFFSFSVNLFNLSVECSKKESVVRMKRTVFCNMASANVGTKSIL